MFGINIYIFFFKKLIHLFCKDALHWSKVPVKTFIMLQKTSISNKCCYFEFSIHQRILKNKTYHCFHKNIKQLKCFQQSSKKKCFLCTKSAYYNYLTLTTGAMMLKIQLWITGINYIWKYIYKTVTYVVVIHNITVYCIFFSLESKRLFSLLTPNFWTVVYIHFLTLQNTLNTYKTLKYPKSPQKINNLKKTAQSFGG